MAKLEFTAAKIGQDVGHILLTDLATDHKNWISHNIEAANNWIVDRFGYQPRVWYYVSAGCGVYEVTFKEGEKVAGMEVVQQISIRPVDNEILEIDA